jgi:glycerophosphoryl diester phosphodiesterase
VNNQIIIAHRGESFLAPENTISSINLAWKNGADAVEIDVRLTKDKHIVVIHDTNTWRVANKFKRIRNSNLKDLKCIDVGKLKNSKYEGERIPNLHEVLSIIPKGKKILIEIKSDSKIIPFLKKEINDSTLLTDQIEIISFELKTLIEVKKQLPQYSVLWVCELDYSLIRKIFRPSINKIISKAIKYNIHGLDLWAGAMLDANAIRKIKLVNLKLYVWTVNNLDQAKVLFKLGVDGVTTDRAGWIKNQLESNY